mgnify:FL=1
MIKDVTNDPKEWEKFWDSESEGREFVYKQTANPNATNSELDAKVIITPDKPYLYHNKTEVPVDFLPNSTECDILIDILRKEDNRTPEIDSIIKKLGYLADLDDGVILEVRK